MSISDDLKRLRDMPRDASRSEACARLTEDVLSRYALDATDANRRNIQGMLEHVVSVERIEDDVLESVASSIEEIARQLSDQEATARLRAQAHAGEAEDLRAASPARRGDDGVESFFVASPSFSCYVVGRRTMRDLIHDVCGADAAVVWRNFCDPDSWCALAQESEVLGWSYSDHSLVVWEATDDPLRPGQRIPG